MRNNKGGIVQCTYNYKVYSAKIKLGKCICLNQAKN